MAHRIVQIVTASPGWWTLERDGVLAPIPLWALVEDDDGKQYVTAVSTPAEGGRWTADDLDYHPERALGYEYVYDSTLETVKKHVREHLHPRAANSPEV